MLKILVAPNLILATPAQEVKVIDNRIVKLVREMEKTLIAQKDPQGVGLAASQVGHGVAIFIMKPTTRAPTEIFINPKVIEDKGRMVKGELGDASSGTPQAWTPTKSRGTLVGKSEGQAPPNQKKQKSTLEGCLSIPRIWAPVRRLPQIEVEYQTVKGEHKKGIFSAFKAVIIQHELDHLAGILFTKRALEQKNPLYEEEGGKLKKMKY